jgi:thymidylate kinase
MTYPKNLKQNILDFRKKEILQFFKYLNDNKKKFAVLGNTVNFPNKIVSDIDLYIEFNSIRELKTLLSNFVKKRGLKISNIYKHEYNSIFFVITKEYKNTFLYMYLDICNYYTYKSFDLINLSNLNTNRLNYKGISFFKLNNVDNVYYYFVKKLMKGDINKLNYQYLKKNKYKLIANINFKNHVKKTILNVLKSNNHIFFKSKISQLRNMIKRKKKIRFIFEIKRILFRIKYKTGYHVAFLGVDGSGKTTQIKKLNYSNYSNLFRNKKNYHLYNLKNYKLNKKVQPYNKSYGYVLSFLKIIYLFLFFSKFYFINLFLMKIKSTLVISDRTHHDVMIDPKRYGIYHNYFFLIKLFSIFPEPDILFYLNVKPNIILRRSKELSKGILKNNLTKYKIFLKKKKTIFINANYNPKEISRKINKILFINLNKKTKLTFKNLV